MREVIERTKKNIPLSMGFGTKLIVNVIGYDTNVNSQLIGMDTGEFILMKLLDESLWQVSAEEGIIGRDITVRYVHDGTIFGFITTVIGAVHFPGGFLFAQYPGSVEEYNLRRQLRVNCLLPTKLIAYYIPLVGHIVDISKQGCRFRAAVSSLSAKIKKEESYTLSIHLPGIENALSLAARAKNIIREKEHVYVGLSFERLDGKTKAVLDHFINNLVS